MAYEINSECISCGACVGTCPVDAIKEASPIYVIDETCIDCGACVDSCPVNAIKSN